MKKKLHSEIWWAAKGTTTGQFYRLAFSKKALDLPLSEEVQSIRVSVTELPKKPTNRRGAKKAGKRLSNPKQI